MAAIQLQVQLPKKQKNQKPKKPNLTSNWKSLDCFCFFAMISMLIISCLLNTIIFFLVHTSSHFHSP